MVTLKGKFSSKGSGDMYDIFKYAYKVNINIITIRYLN